MKKKGSVIDILIWIVIAFVVVTFFGLWIYGFDRVTTALIAIPGSPEVNISDAASITFGQVNTAQTTGLHVLAYAIIFMLALAILITNFLEKSNAAFFVVYLFVLIGAIISSVYVSNQYEDLLTNEIVGSTFQAFSGSNFILLYLPVWVTVIGFMGAIFLFAGILRDRAAGGGI